MMTKELPNVTNDKGYQKDARDFAKKIMKHNELRPFMHGGKAY